jgi:hypothetical protein
MTETCEDDDGHELTPRGTFRRLHLVVMPG